ncbi:MAG: sugar ABC transporter permease [Clostridiales bacterium]|nr:sugar ABC transporter permease [Clostridiales bacterium]
MAINRKHNQPTSKLGRDDRRLGILLILPVVLFMLFLVAYPLYNLFSLSTQNFNMLTQKTKFVGLLNFQRVLAGDDFWQSLWRTLMYAVGTLIPCAVLGTLFAVLLNKDIPARSFVRSFVIFPYIIPMVVSCAIFRYLFNDLVGILDHYAVCLGLAGNTLNLFGRTDLAMIGVILVSVWKYTPMIMIAVLGKLQTISCDYYEAAQVDGANQWQQFRHITFPFILPPLIVVMLMRFIFLFNKWDIIYLLTGGGPLNATATLPMKLYGEAFSSYNLGKAAALGVIMFVLLLASSKFYYKMNDIAERRL